MARHSAARRATDGWVKCFHPGFLAPTEEKPKENNTVWVPNRFRMFKWKWNLLHSCTGSAPHVNSPILCKEMYLRRRKAERVYEPVTLEWNRGHLLKRITVLWVMVHKPSSRLVLSFLLRSIKRRAFENSAAKVGQRNLSNRNLEFQSPGRPLKWKSVFKRTKLQRVGRFLNIFLGVLLWDALSGPDGSSGLMWLWPAPLWSVPQGLKLKRGGTSSATTDKMKIAPPLPQDLFQTT